MGVLGPPNTPSEPSGDRFKRMKNDRKTSSAKIPELLSWKENILISFLEKNGWLGGDIFAKYPREVTSFYLKVFHKLMGTQTEPLTVGPGFINLLLSY